MWLWAPCFLTGSGITLDQLYSTASSRRRLERNQLRLPRICRLELRRAEPRNRTVSVCITGADFGDAEISGAIFDTHYRRGAYLGQLFGTGFTLDQLYSTASYEAHDLTGIRLGANNLSGGNFVGQNLANSNLGCAICRAQTSAKPTHQCICLLRHFSTNADFTAADARRRLTSTSMLAQSPPT